MFGPHFILFSYAAFMFSGEMSFAEFNTILEKEVKDDDDDPPDETEQTVAETDEIRESTENQPHDAPSLANKSPRVCVRLCTQLHAHRPNLASLLLWPSCYTFFGIWTHGMGVSMIVAKAECTQVIEAGTRPYGRGNYAFRTRRYRGSQTDLHGSYKIRYNIVMYCTNILNSV